MAKAKKADVKNELLKTLEANGTVGVYYEDLVDDYMALWDTKNSLQKDIKKRGVTVEISLADGRIKTVKNESLGELVKVNQQMLKLLDSLGIHSSQGDGTADDPL